MLKISRLRSPDYEVKISVGFSIKAFKGFFPYRRCFVVEIFLNKANFNLWHATIQANRIFTELKKQDEPTLNKGFWSLNKCVCLSTCRRFRHDSHYDKFLCIVSDKGFLSMFMFPYQSFPN